MMFTAIGMDLLWLENEINIFMNFLTKAVMRINKEIVTRMGSIIGWYSGSVPKRPKMLSNEPNPHGLLIHLVFYIALVR